MNDFLSSIYSNNISNVRDYITKGESMPYSVDKDSGFVIACALGYKEIVELFFEFPQIFHSSVDSNKQFKNNFTDNKKLSEEISYGLIRAVMSSKRDLVDYLFSHSLSKDIVQNMGVEEKDLILRNASASLKNMELLFKYNFIHADFPILKQIYLLKQSGSGTVFNFLIHNLSTSVLKEYFKDIVKNDNVAVMNKNQLSFIEFFIKEEKKEKILEFQHIFQQFSHFKLFNFPHSKDNALFFLQICNEALLAYKLEDKFAEKDIKDNYKVKKKL